MWTCQTNLEWVGHVRGSKNRVYEIFYRELDTRRSSEQGAEFGWMCGCPAFIFGAGLDHRGCCKHVKEIEARQDRCGWSGVEPKSTKHGVTCPDCGGPVEEKDGLT